MDCEIAIACRTRLAYSTLEHFLEHGISPKKFHPFSSCLELKGDT